MRKKISVLNQSIGGVLIILVIAGWSVYQYQQDENKRHDMTWEFAEKDGSQLAYCMYLKEFPKGRYADQAHFICSTYPTPKTHKPATPENPQNFELEMVKLPTGIWMGKYEVTQNQWLAVMGSNPSAYRAFDFPVENVSWNDVQIFIAQLNKKTGKTYRLPTEKEWLEACQAGENHEYCGSNDVDKIASYDGMPHSVGQRKPNAWGLYDMSGNVFEWTSSFYDNKHNGRVVRGGSWNHTPEASRSKNCHGFKPDIHYNFQGFRLVKD